MDQLDAVDDDIERSVSELGEPDALFQIGRRRFLAKLAGGILVIAFGIVGNYLWWVHGPGKLDHMSMLLLLGLPVVGCGLLWHMYRQRGLKILIYPTGLLRLRRGEIASFPWQEVDHIRVKIEQVNSVEIVRDADGIPSACWLPVQVPTLKLWRTGLTIARKDGEEAQFSAALGDFTGLAEEIQKRTFTARWPSIWKRFLNGSAIEFGELELSLAGIHHAGKIIPWSEAKELTVHQGKLRLKQGKKWFRAVIAEDFFAVTNPHILFALASVAMRAAV